MLVYAQAEVNDTSRDVTEVFFGEVSGVYIIKVFTMYGEEEVLLKTSSYDKAFRAFNKYLETFHGDLYVLWT